MERAAQLMDWKAKWHPHGKGQAKGSIVDGLGMAIHTWGGGGRPVELQGQDPSQRRRRDVRAARRTSAPARGRSSRWCWPRRLACRTSRSASTSAARSIRPAAPAAAARRSAACANRIAARARTPLPRSPSWSAKKLDVDAGEAGSRQRPRSGRRQSRARA